MAFCGNCGAQTQGKFCAKCGASLEASVGNAPPPAWEQPSPPPPPPQQAAPMGDNVAGALCYLFGIITGVLFLVMEPYNRSKTVRFHAFQSIFTNLAWFVGFVGLMILHAIMPWSLLALLGILTLMWWVLGFGVILALMWKAYENRPLVLPVIGALAQKQA